MLRLWLRLFGCSHRGADLLLDRDGAPGAFVLRCGRCWRVVAPGSFR